MGAAVDDEGASAKLLHALEVFGDDLLAEGAHVVVRGGEVDGVGGVADDDEALLPLLGELLQLAFSENAGFAAARIAREHLHGVGADGARITRCAVEAFSCGHMGAEMKHASFPPYGCALAVYPCGTPAAVL